MSDYELNPDLQSLETPKSRYDRLNTTLQYLKTVKSGFEKKTVISKIEEILVKNLDAKIKNIETEIKNIDSFYKGIEDFEYHNRAGQSQSYNLEQGKCYEYSRKGNKYKYLGKFQGKHVTNSETIFLFEIKNISVPNLNLERNLERITFDSCECKTSKSKKSSWYNTFFGKSSNPSLSEEAFMDVENGGGRKSKPRKGTRRKKTIKFVTIPLTFDKKKTLKNVNH